MWDPAPRDMRGQGCTTARGRSPPPPEGACRMVCLEKAARWTGRRFAGAGWRPCRHGGVTPPLPAACPARPPAWGGLSGTRPGCPDRRWKPPAGSGWPRPRRRKGPGTSADWRSGSSAAPVKRPARRRWACRRRKIPAASAARGIRPAAARGKAGRTRYGRRRPRPAACTASCGAAAPR